MPGHEVVGRVVELGDGAEGQFRVGEQVGIPWLGRTCGVCAYCHRGLENLCDAPGFTGYTTDGGYAEEAACCFPLPEGYGARKRRRSCAPG